MNAPRYEYPLSKDTPIPLIESSEAHFEAITHFWALEAPKYSRTTSDLALIEPHSSYSINTVKYLGCLPCFNNLGQSSLQSLFLDFESLDILRSSGACGAMCNI
jgi:hypothetical protein